MGNTFRTGRYYGLLLRMESANGILCGTGTGTCRCFEQGGPEFCTGGVEIVNI